MKPLESLLRAFVELHPEDAARAFETLDIAEGARLVEQLPVGDAVSLLERVGPHVTAELLQQLAVERASELLAAMATRTAVSVLQHMDQVKREEALASLPERVSQQLRQLANYPGDTAGGIMEPRVASLPADLTVEQAIATIRRTPRESLYYLYVTDRDGKLVGVLNMRDLLLGLPHNPIQSLVRRNLLTVPDTMDREEVVNLMRQRRFLALPVVDFEGRLIGIVKHNEALEAGQLEAFEDMQKSVGAGGDERALSPVSLVVKSRLPWLYVNLLTAFMAAAVVGLFEDFIAKVAALAVLMPVVAGQGGNTGSQSLAVVMRGLALREIIPSMQKKVIVKEVLGGLINSVCIAVVTALVVFAWRAIQGDPAHFSVGLAAVIGLAMIINMVAAALAGAIIPLLLKALGRDPAQSAAIFLTTVTDIVGFGAFLGFAMLCSSWLL